MKSEASTLADSFVDFLVWLKRLHPVGSLDDASSVYSIQAIDLVYRIYCNPAAPFAVAIYNRIYDITNHHEMVFS